MKAFLSRFGMHILGILSGFDRLRIRGTKRLLANVRGMMAYLWWNQVKLTDFVGYAKGITAQLKQSIEDHARRQDRPVIYLHSSRQSKEELARAIARQDQIRQGLIAVLQCVEPCRTYSVGPDRQTKKSELRLKPAKCLHSYFYFLDPRFGLMHARLQLWFPFNMHLCLNGREWLARQMKAEGIGFVRRDNCFTHIEDIEAAQALMDQQLCLNWQDALQRVVEASFPTHAALFVDTEHPVPYYWSIEESEWATDVMFGRAEDLRSLMPRFVRHAMEHVSSPDVLRFLGQPGIKQNGEMHGNFTGEVASDLKRRQEGVRVKHRLKGNWIKMYDKQGSVLRIETVMNNPRDLKVYRTKENDPEGKPSWLRLRKGMADTHRRAELSQKSNERYLESLASVEQTETVGEVASRLGQPVAWKGRSARALNILNEADVDLLRGVGRGEFVMNGFRNRDLRAILYGASAETEQARRRQSASVTRRLRLLRAHGVIRKVAKTHRYMVTETGRAIITAVLAAREAEVATLTQAA